MKIEPLFDRVVLKAVEQESITSSGIYIPDSANKELSFEYVVIAIGPWKTDRDMSGISIWDIVLCGQYSGDEVKVGDERFKVVAIEYILGIIK